MSMARCDGCDWVIDTDSDLECYRLRSNPNRHWGDDGDYRPDNICLCEWCREERKLDE